MSNSQNKVVPFSTTAVVFSQSSLSRDILFEVESLSIGFQRRIAGAIPRHLPAS